MHLRPETLTGTPAADVAVVIVHYHTPHLAAEAVSALRGDGAGGAAPRLECLIVDNGNDAAGVETLRGLGVTVLAADRNLGYAGGVNLGVASTRAPFVIVMNADVIIRPGCLAALIDELRRTKCAVAGPRFSWDRAGRLLLPPTERRDFTSDALARLSTRGAHWASAARMRWRRHARKHWTARESIDSFALSGALLALRREAWTAIGPFDEGFRLYFEETDWLTRAAARGWRGRYVPAAQAVHLYDRSARHEPLAQSWFAESARRFEQKHASRLRGRCLRWLSASSAARRRGAAEPMASLEFVDADADMRGDAIGVAQPARLTGAAPAIALPLDSPRAGAASADSQGRWIEISSQPAGYPAAAERLDALAPEPHEAPRTVPQAAGCPTAAERLDALAPEPHEAPRTAPQAAGYPTAAERLGASARERDETRRTVQQSTNQLQAQPSQAVTPALHSQWRWPADVWEHLAPGTYTLRLVDDAGREHGATTFVR